VDRQQQAAAAEATFHATSAAIAVAFGAEPKSFDAYLKRLRA